MHKYAIHEQKREKKKKESGITHYKLFIKYITYEQNTVSSLHNPNTCNSDPAWPFLPYTNKTTT